MDRTGAHPLRRADDAHDPRLDVVLTHLDYLRGGLDNLNDKVAIQNGRIYRTEAQLADLTTRATVKVEELSATAALTDRNIKILGIVVTVVGMAVTGAIKWL